MSSSIEEIRENYKDLFEYSLDYIFITDLNGKILEINKTLLQDLEISASKIISKNLYEFLVNIEVAEEQDKKQQLKQFKTSRELLIYKLNKKNGSPIFIEISKIPITKNDQVVAFLGIGRNITRQINMDNNLYAISQHSKEIENIINHSPIVAFTWKNDKGWPVEFVSDNIIQFGYEPKEFLTGKLLYSDIIYPDDLERVSREFMHKEQKNYNEFTLECRIITKNSQMRWVNHHIWIKRNEKGEIKYYHGIILDITEKKIEEIKLRESEELFRNVFEILPYYSIIYRIVKDHITLIAYNKLADRYGRTDYKELLGKRRNYFSINEDDRHYFYDKMIHCIKTKKSIIEEDDFYNEYLKSRRDLVRIY
ncbi:MAG: PAS domain S-box protein, partial [Promethearchaeota archaeon]